MKLPDDIQIAAHNLGQLLMESPQVADYQKAVLAVAEDKEALNLEEKLHNLHQHLASQERAGQTLDQSELNEYYLLRDRVRQSPLISERDEQLQLVKLLFYDTNRSLSSRLGFDFTILAL